MRLYRRTSFENWSWPPLFSSEKPLFPPISYRKKNVGRFFDTDVDKRDFPNRKKNRFPQKKHVFCSKMKTIVYQNLRPEKSVKVVAISSLIEKKHTRFHHLQLYLWEWRLFIVLQIIIRFFLWQAKFLYLISMSVFYSIWFCIVVC